MWILRDGGNKETRFGNYCFKDFRKYQGQTLTDLLLTESKWRIVEIPGVWEKRSC